MDYQTRKVLLAVALVVGAVGSVVAGYRLYRLIDTARVDPEQVHAEGTQFGHGKVDSACVEVGLERAQACWLWDKRCEVEAGIFTFGCMASARQTKYCEKFPSGLELAVPDIGLVSSEQMGVGGSGAARKACAARGLDQDSGCEMVMKQAIARCSIGNALGGF